MTDESNTHLDEALALNSAVVVGICDDAKTKQETLRANEVKQYEDNNQEIVFALWDVEGQVAELANPSEYTYTCKVLPSKGSKGLVPIANTF